METSEKMMTVREFAEALNVSKAKINYQLSKIDSQLIVKRKGINYLSEEAQRLVKNALKANQDITQISSVPPFEQQLKELRNQLEVKDSQITQLYRLLDQQQQLTLQSNRQVETLQLQLRESFETDFPVIDVSKLRDSLDEQHRAFEKIKEQLDEKEKENQLLQESNHLLVEQAKKSWIQRLLHKRS